MTDREGPEPALGFRSGFVAVIGRPNVGKSTLINALLEQKIAAVSPRPQTTRRRQLGILTRPQAQLVFIDTPGFHQPQHKLGVYMNSEVEASLEGADAILFLIDIAAVPTAEDTRIADLIRDLKQRPPVVLAANKVDLVTPQAAAENLAAYRLLLPAGSEAVLISAAQRTGLEALVDVLSRTCPLGEPMYDADQITDLYEREIAADLIREVALSKLRDEVPHGLAVRIDEFKERGNGMDYIHATLLVERESQKAIVIGQGGKMLKQIGTDARRQIEILTERRAFLELRVKVEKGWRNRESSLEELGYKQRR